MNTAKAPKPVPPSPEASKRRPLELRLSIPELSAIVVAAVCSLFLLSLMVGVGIFSIEKVRRQARANEEATSPDLLREQADNMRTESAAVEERKWPENEHDTAHVSSTGEGKNKKADPNEPVGPVDGVPEDNERVDGNQGASHSDDPESSNIEMPSSDTGVLAETVEPEPEALEPSGNDKRASTMEFVPANTQHGFRSSMESAEPLVVHLEHLSRKPIYGDDTHNRFISFDSAPKHASIWKVRLDPISNAPSRKFILDTSLSVTPNELAVIGDFQLSFRTSRSHIL